MKKNLIVESSCLLLIVLFSYAAVSKITDYSNFKLQLGQSPFIEYFSPLLTWAVPIVELIAVGLLLFNRSKLAGLYLSLFLMTLFSAYIYAMLHYSYYIPCSCGGVLNKLDWREHLWLNLGFTIVCITGILAEVLPRNKPFVTPTSSPV